MESIHFPIKDKWVPDSMDQLILLVETIITRLRQGKTVVCHCNGGKGRSGTVVVAALVGLGRKVEHSIDIVRRSRSGTIRNPLQIVYVKNFKTTWKKRHKEKMATAQPADEDDEEAMDPEELAIWKKWEEKLLDQGGDEEKDSTKSPMVEPVIEAEDPSMDDSMSQTVSPGAKENSGISTSGGTGQNRAANDKKRDAGLRGSIWKKDKREENKGKSKEELKSEEKKRKQERHYAKKVEKQQKALEKQKMKVAKENARLLAAQSPQLAVGASRRSTDLSFPQPSHPETETSAVHGSSPGGTNMSASAPSSASNGTTLLTHNGYNEAMTTVAEVKEDDENSVDKGKTKLTSSSAKPSSPEKAEKDSQPSSRKAKEHEGDESSDKDSTVDDSTVETSETSSEQESS